MKKILFLLLLSVATYGQTYQNPTFGTVKTMTAPTVVSPVNLATTDANGVIGKSSNAVNQINSSNNSGLLLGGGLSVNADPTKWDLAFGEGYVSNSLTGVVEKISWGTQTGLTTPYRTTSVATYVLMANAGGGFGTLVLQNTAPTQQQFRTHIYLGKLAHTTFGNILFAVTEPSRMFDTAGQISDLNRFLGSGNVDGNVITYNGANMNINASAGMTYRPGANYLTDRNSPSITTEPSFTAGTFRNKFRNGSGGWTAVNTTTVDNNHWDNGSGILQVVPNNKWTIMVFWRFGGTGTIHCDYGQAVYDNKVDALLAAGKIAVSEDPENKRDASRRAWLVVKQGVTVLNDINTAEFINADKLGERSAGSSSTGTLQTAYNNSVTPQITTTTGGGAVAIKRGSAADTDNVLVVQNGSGSNTFSVNGNGDIVGKSISILGGSGYISGNLYAGGEINFSGDATFGSLKYNKSINVGSTDLNNLTVAGFYEGYAFSNAPISGYIWVEVQRYSATNDWVNQRVTTFGSGNSENKIFSRVKNNGVWGNWEEISKLETPEILIPSYIYATVGKQLNLYYDSLILAADKGINSPVGYTVEVYCLKGRMDERSWNYTPISGDIGTTSLIVRVYNINSKLVSEKTVNLVTQADSAPVSVKNILMIGDSITEEGTIVSTVRNSFISLGSNTPVFWGLKGTGSNKHEGRGGWTFASFVNAGSNWYRFNVSGVTSVAYFDLYSHNGNEYRIMEVNITGGTGYVRAELSSGTNPTLSSGTLTKVSGSGDATISFSSYSIEASNPFWNVSALDIANYRSVLGMGSSKFDLVTIQLGINGAGTTPQNDAQIEAIINDAKTLCNAFLADNASTKIIIMLPTSCGNTKGGWASGYGSVGLKEFFRYNIFRLNKKIVSTFDYGIYNSNISVGYAGLTIDRYFGYGLTTRSVGDTYTDTEETHNNAVHPRTQGYEQIGQSIFPQIKNSL